MLLGHLFRLFFLICRGFLWLGFLSNWHWLKFSNFFRFFFNMSLNRCFIIFLMDLLLDLLLFLFNSYFVGSLYLFYWNFDIFFFNIWFNHLSLFLNKSWLRILLFDFFLSNNWGALQNCLHFSFLFLYLHTTFLNLFNFLYIRYFLTTIDHFHFSPSPMQNLLLMFIIPPCFFLYFDSLY